MLTTQQFVICLACSVVIIYLIWFICRERAGDDEYGMGDLEPFESTTTPPTSEDKGPRKTASSGAPPSSSSTRMIKYDLQNAINFSDVTVSAQQHEELQELQENAKQIQTVDERFEAAKRKSEAHGMHPGIMPNKKRRQLVEALVRRPFCGRRTRSWRTEFSDNLRGDVVPKNLNNELGMMRIGRSDPSIDLHPGALGQVSGINGRWLSTESVPDNAFDDVDGPM